MSGHTDFTIWIKKNCDYVIHKGVKKKVKEVYFISDPFPNNDSVVIDFRDGTSSTSFKDIDLDDLAKRFHENKDKKTSS